MKYLLYLSIFSMTSAMAFDLPDIENIDPKAPKTKSFERIKKEMIAESPINLRDILKDDFYITKNGSMFSKDESKKSVPVRITIERSKLKPSTDETVDSQNYLKKTILINNQTTLLNAKYNNLDKNLNVINSRNITLLNGENIEDIMCELTSIPSKPPKKALVGYNSPETRILCEGEIEYVSSYKIKQGAKPEIKILSISEKEIVSGKDNIHTILDLNILNNEIISYQIEVDSENSIIKTTSTNEKTDYTTTL